MSKSLISYILLICLSGCALFGLSSANEKNFKEVRVGQTAQQVTSHIGEPSSKEAVKNGELWSYRILRDRRDASDPYTLRFDDQGILRTIQFDTHAAHEDDGIEAHHQADKNTGLPCEPIRGDDGKSYADKSCEPGLGL
jgi:outer membrane protein assembly factor BamE (lipoprotein component of BamABCDE complex)